MLDEYEVRHRPCAWCGKELGRYSYSPDGIVNVHRACHHWAWHEATTKQLGEYIDRLEAAR